MNRTTREWMERWARWRHYRHGGIGKTMTEKLLEGMPGTRCPSCGGGGKRGKQTCLACGGTGHARLMPEADKAWREPCTRCMRDGRSTGEVAGRTCVNCGGKGYRLQVEHKVNPAFIRSTYQSPDDPLSQRIDRLVCELRQRDVLLGYWFVVNAEYCDARGGTQASKAQRLLLTPDCYESRLRRAVEWVGAAVPDQRPCSVIPFPYKAA